MSATVSSGRTARHRGLRRIAGAAAGIAILALSMPALAGADAVDQPAPALVATQLDGHEFDLAALRGRVVVLNLWATWCPPCRAEMPLLEAFYRKYAPQGVIVVGMSADDPHDRRDVVRAMRGLSYPAALLKEARSNGFGMPQALPVTYVIDAAGVVRARLLPTKGALTEAALAAVVEPLLTPPAAPPP